MKTYLHKDFLQKCSFTATSFKIEKMKTTPKSMYTMEYYSRTKNKPWI